MHESGDPCPWCLAPDWQKRQLFAKADGGNRRASILTHIMHWYSHFGYNEFIIALGYKGDQIKQYFLNYYALNSDITVKVKSGAVSVHDGQREDWVVHLVDTGTETMTGERVGRLRRWLTDDTFMLTYGDGLADVRSGSANGVSSAAWPAGHGNSSATPGTLWRTEV